MGFTNEKELLSVVNEVLDNVLKHERIEYVNLGGVECRIERHSTQSFLGTDLDEFLKESHHCDAFLDPEALLEEPNQRTKASFEVKRNWAQIWRTFAARFGASFVSLGEGAIPKETVVRKPNIIPHVRPVWLIIVYQELVLVVSPFKSATFSFSQVLKFAHRNLDVQSEEIHLVLLQLIECLHQLSKRGIFPVYSSSLFECDNVIWLECDAVRALKTMRVEGIVKEEKTLDQVTEMWRSRQISNFEYIIQINEFAGRKKGEIHNHPIVPWVVDFTSETDGWRPLERTKYRLQKGDQQLKEMYQREPAHHIPELLSELSYMVYRARIEPKERLCKYVRAKWEPREYPSSVRRMFELAPDECIPELYEDPKLLVSVHPDMPDIELPQFANKPEKFIKWHREKFESEEVSAKLNEWIDLTFGYKLQGEEAVKALNVHLCYAEQDRKVIDHGVVQLFQRPHPKRLLATNKTKNFVGLDSKFEAHLADKTVPSKSPSQDCPSLVDNFKKLLGNQETLQKYRSISLKSILITMIEISLPSECNNFLPSASFEARRQRALALVSQFTFKLPRHLRESTRWIVHYLSEKHQLPNFHDFHTSFPLEFHVPPEVLLFHDHLASFYGFHLIRKYSFVTVDEKRHASALHGEVESLRGCLLESSGSQQREARLALLVARLLNDPRASIAAVSRLFPTVCKTFSKSSIDLLFQPVKALLHNESTVKLLDRRFLLQVSIAYGARQFLEEIAPTLIEAVASKVQDRSIVAKESIVWLAKRYGPVVCARFISSNLLRILATCYTNLEVIATFLDHKDAFNQPLEGDTTGIRVEHCLSEIAASYSSTFITVQYIPFCADLIDQVLRRGPQQLEPALVSILRIARVSMRALSDAQLMNYLEDMIIGKIISRISKMVCSENTSFTSISVRRVLASKILAFLLELSRRVGAENVRMYAKQPFETFFESFVLLYEANEELIMYPKVTANPTLLESFPLWFVDSVVVCFCEEWGVPMLSSFCSEPAFLVPFVSAQSSSSPSHCSMTGVSLGNRLFSLSSPCNSASYSILGGSGCFDSGGSLSQLWCARVSAAVCGNGARQSPRFDQITLCSFSGHSGTIRRIEPLSNENSFVSASSDKTVKLWSIRHDQETSQCQWTYKGHSNSVRDVRLLDSGLIASTDGCLHVWDPFRGAVHSQLDWGSDGMIHCMDTLDRHTLVAASSLHSSVKIHDTRAADWISELRVSPLNGVVRSLSIRGNRMAISLSNGTVAVVDPRTGRIGSLSHGNHTHANGIAWLSPTAFIVSDSDEEAVVFDASPKIERCWSTPDLVQCIASDGDLLVTVQQANTFRLYSGQEMALSAKIKNDVIPGQVTALAYLSLNNNFILGSNSGTIRLLC
ncbi:unnamed protein product, partial [Mesorhabditis belari]|uniref:BEACH domain-containing protein n=1 Tax=Mesorhabditis belari TaxID=2138241 RepID=A0AAF3EAU0_9BILA